MNAFKHRTKIINADRGFLSSVDKHKLRKKHIRNDAAQHKVNAALLVSHVAAATSTTLKKKTIITQDNRQTKAIACLLTTIFKLKNCKNHESKPHSYKFYSRKKTSKMDKNSISKLTDISHIRKKKSIITSTGLFVINNDVSSVDESGKQMASTGNGIVDIPGRKRAHVTPFSGLKKYKVELPMALAKLLFPKVMNNYDETIIQIYPVPNRNGGKSLVLKVSHKALKDKKLTGPSKLLENSPENENNLRSDSTIGESFHAGSLSSDNNAGSTIIETANTSGDSHNKTNILSTVGNINSSIAGLNDDSDSKSDGKDSESTTIQSNVCFPGGFCTGCCNECCPSSKYGHAHYE